MTQRPRIPFLVPEMPSADQLLPFLHEIDENRHYSNFGPLERRFVKDIAVKLCKTNPPSVVTLANATIGLELAISNLGLERGARVCIPAFTFVATATAVLRSGMTLCVADVDPNSWVLTPDIAKDAMKVQSFDAVIVVSTFGAWAEPEAWDAFVEETGVPVVIDAAAAIGTQVPGRRCPAVYSLHATKALGAGEGGLIAMYDAEKAAEYQRLTNFGIDTCSPERIVPRAGLNAKLSEYHAAVALASLQTWEERFDHRQALYQYYCHAFEARGISVAVQRFDKPVFHNYMNIRFVDAVPIHKIQSGLAEAGIETRRSYLPLIEDHPAFSRAERLGALSHAEALASSMISLPFHAHLSRDEIDYVADTLKHALLQLGL